MKKGILKLGISLGVIAVLFSGCGQEPRPFIKKVGFDENAKLFSIRADSESVANTLSIYGLKTMNYKYAFAMAAKLTKEKGYQYFTIKTPQLLLEQFKKRDVKNVDSAYKACTEGDGAFSWVFSLNVLREKSNCDSISSEINKHGLITTTLNPIQFAVTLHNENTKDNVTFNADEVLNSPIIKELDMSKIANIKVQE